LNQLEYAKEFILEILRDAQHMSSYNLKDSCGIDGISEATYDRAKAELYKQEKVNRDRKGNSVLWSIKK